MLSIGVMYVKMQAALLPSLSKGRGTALAVDEYAK